MSEIHKSMPQGAHMAATISRLSERVKELQDDVIDVCARCGQGREAHWEEMLRCPKSRQDKTYIPVKKSAEIARLSERVAELEGSLIVAQGAGSCLVYRVAELEKDGSIRGLKEALNTVAYYRDTHIGEAREAAEIIYARIDSRRDALATPAPPTKSEPESEL